MKRERHILLNGIPDKVHKALQTCHAIIAGGAVTSVFSSQPINDYDIYFRGPELMASFQRLLDDPHTITDCADTYKIDGKLFQAIKVYHGTPYDIIEKFDFTICQGAYDFLANDFYLGENFLKHLAQKRLVYTGLSEFPIASLYRLKKYIQRGFACSGIEIIKLALQIQRLEISNYGQLRRQLMGIDTLFLKELMDQLDAEKKYDLEECIEMLTDHLEGKWNSIT